jgi:hypothetical protein
MEEMPAEAVREGCPTYSDIFCALPQSQNAVNVRLCNHQNMLLGSRSDIIEGNVVVILQTNATNEGQRLEFANCTSAMHVLNSLQETCKLEDTGLTSYKILLGSWPLAIRQNTQYDCADRYNSNFR